MKISERLLMCPVQEYKNVEEISVRLKKGKLYKYDNIGDVIKDYLIHPRVIECRLDNEELIGDCDDHAIYWCTAIKKSNLAKKVWFSFFTMKHKGIPDQYSSHAVCVFIANDDKYYWCDYTNPRNIEKLSDFQIKSAELYGCEAICGAMWEIKQVKSDDTPIFGKILRVLPGENIQL